MKFSKFVPVKSGILKETGYLIDWLFDYNLSFSQVVRKSSSDVALVIGAGVTLYEALSAADALSAQGVNIRVLDLFTVKPLDVEAIKANAKECGGRIVTVEDHYHEGEK